MLPDSHGGSHRFESCGAHHIFQGLTGNLPEKPIHKPIPVEFSDGYILGLRAPQPNTLFRTVISCTPRGGLSAAVTALVSGSSALCGGGTDCLGVRSCLQ